MKKYVSISKASEIMGVSPSYLRKLANEGKIEHIKTEGGSRRFDVSGYSTDIKKPCTTICYCRVSSQKQKDDLQRQVGFMQEKFPDAKIVKDIGSGINFHRQGLNSILEQSLSGTPIKLVVAHKDRLCRFGCDLIEQIIKRSGGELVVLNNTALSPEQELTQDLCSIIHVFSCRLHGLRKYKTDIQKDKDLPHSGTEEDFEAMDGCEQTYIQ